MKLIARASVWLFALIWLAFAIYGVVAFQQTEATGSGFTRGSNRMAEFFRWEFFALGAAVMAFVSRRISGDGGAVKFAGRLPLILSGGFFLIIIAAFVGVLIWTRVFGG